MSNLDQKILQCLSKGSQNNESISKHTGVGSRTTLRKIKELVQSGFVQKIGKGKSTQYSIAQLGRLMYEPSKEDLLDSRLETGELISFNFDLIPELSQNLFDESETKLLKNLQKEYTQTISQQEIFLKKREFERLVIEFSWKSSSIEGNTYTLLETEELLENVSHLPHNKHSQYETQMVLNHKTAFDFALNNKEYFRELNITKILNLHKLLVHDLDIPLGLRNGSVGITGTNYKPLDTKYQIQEALELMCEVINTLEPFQKALVTGLIMSYIQPFFDGNKRSSRLLSNALLLAYDHPLLSFRSVSVEEYRSAIISFYEYNSIVLYKRLFINQLEYFLKAYF